MNGTTIVKTKDGKTHCWRDFIFAGRDGEFWRFKNASGTEIRSTYPEGVESIHYNTDTWFDIKDD